MAVRTVADGIGLPLFGGPPTGIGIGPMALAIEQAGLDVWLSDHIVLVEPSESRYPFSEDGSFWLPADQDWYDFVSVAAYIAALTTKCEIGVGVAVAALRPPIELAKQVATIDRLSAGRFRLGVGAGWLAEEFEALGVPFKGRGARLDAALALMRQAWTGRPETGEYGPYAVPPNVHVFPTPTRRVPIYVGGESGPALRRIIEYGDGWLGEAAGGQIDEDKVAGIGEKLTELCRNKGRDPAEIELALRYGISRRALQGEALLDHLVDLRLAGVRRFVVDIAWRDLEDATSTLRSVRSVLDESAAIAAHKVSPNGD